MKVNRPVPASRAPASRRFCCDRAGCDRISLPRSPQGRKITSNRDGNPKNVGLDYVVVTGEKFRTERLVARSWQIEDLPFAMELWGDRAVTAVIESRGKLTEEQVQEKLRIEIDR